MKKIFIRSPYFIEIDEEAQTTAKIEIFLWNKVASEPITPNYTLSKNVPSINQNKLSWNVANYAKEFIKPIAPVTVSVPTEESADTWCYMRVVSYSDDVEVNNETFVCLNGYTIYSGGYNQYSDDIIIPLVNTNIKLTTFYGVEYINVWLEESNDYGWFGESDDFYFTTTSEGLWKLPYDYDIWGLDTSPYLKPRIFSIQAEQLCEHKYSPFTCTFINRYGGWQFLTFFKAITRSIDVTSKDFNMLPSSINYDVLKGQKRVFNSQGKQKIKCNTGWVDENYFDLIQDLLLSETVLLDNKPVTVKSQSADYKTNIKEKNINYEIEFEYNFGLINDVI